MSYLIWRLQLPAERREALIREMMKKRWETGQELFRFLAELKHGLPYILGSDKDRRDLYLSRGREDRQKAREETRKGQPLLGNRVTQLVQELTDRYESVYSAVEAGKKPEEQLEGIAALDRQAHGAIETELMSPMSHRGADAPRNGERGNL